MDHRAAICQVMELGVMASHKSAGGPPIQKLIEERAQIGQWLEKLAGATDKPEQVRTKVRAGYEKRLAEIMAELQGYQKEIEETLKRHRVAYEALQLKEKETTEELAEVELRHSVGEYTEAGWRKANAEITNTLSKVREGLTAAAEAVTRVEAVLATLSKGAAEAAPARRPTPLATQPEASVPGTSRMSEFIPDPDPVIPTLSQPSAPTQPPAESKPATPRIGRQSIATSPLGPRPSAPSLTPPSGVSPAPGQPTPPTKAKQTDAFDELAFLKSVTDDEKHAPSAARASGMARLSSSEPVIPDQALLDAQAASPPRPAPKPTAPAPAPAPKAAPANQDGAKTVKCGDCGTMNLPTEWYCEKCGAELSAV